MHRSVSGSLGANSSSSDGNDASSSHESDDHFDFEAAQSIPAVASLSSVEHQFDYLLQQLTYRDKGKFIAYVKREIEATISREGNGATNAVSSSSLLQPDSPHKTLLSSAAGSSIARLSQKLSNLVSPFWHSVLERFALLAGLLFLQSCSSLILGHFADFIAKHVVVTLYLTMLVGAGGNAGNQAAVMVIRMLAVTGGSGGKGSGGGHSVWRLLWKETQVALILGCMMLVVGFGRVFLFEGGDVAAATAITLSLWVIVTSSIVLGAALPLLLHRFKLDPAHAGPCIQVLMDVLGVALTCCICSLVLGDGAAGSRIKHSSLEAAG